MCYPVSFCRREVAQFALIDGETDSAGFYAENLLLYSEQARGDGVLPLPIGDMHKFAPVALGVSSGLEFGDDLS